MNTCLPDCFTQESNPSNNYEKIISNDELANSVIELMTIIDTILSHPKGRKTIKSLMGKIFFPDTDNSVATVKNSIVRSDKSTSTTDSNNLAPDSGCVKVNSSDVSATNINHTHSNSDLERMLKNREDHILQLEAVIHELQLHYRGKTKEWEIYRQRDSDDDSVCVSGNSNAERKRESDSKHAASDNSTINAVDTDKSVNGNSLKR